MIARPRGGGEHHVRLGEAAHAARDDLDRTLRPSRAWSSASRSASAEPCTSALMSRLTVPLESSPELRERVFGLLPGLARQADVAELALAIQRDFARLALAVDRRAARRPRSAGPRARASAPGSTGPRSRLPCRARRTARARGRTARRRRPSRRSCSVPRLTSTVATAPRPRSTLASRTTPVAGASCTALSSSTSACSRMRLEQRVDALAGLRRDRHEDVLAAPFLRDHAFLRQLVPDLFGIGVVLVDLVDRDDDRHVRRLRVLDRFLGLRHDAVVGRDDQDDDVGDLRAARAHRRERRVARRVEEGDDAARRLDVVGADVLGDAARFARRDLGAADVVEQRGLAVVDVAHDRDDRRTRQRLVRGCHAGLQLFLDLVGLQHLGDVAHFLDHEHRGVLVDGLVDRRHDAHVEHRLHDFARLDRHALGELGDRDGLADRDLALHRLRSAARNRACGPR